MTRKVVIDDNDPNTKIRKCLRCKKDFKSWGAGNRICTVCKPRLDNSDGLTESSICIPKSTKGTS